MLITFFMLVTQLSTYQIFIKRSPITPYYDQSELHPLSRRAASSRLPFRFQSVFSVRQHSQITRNVLAWKTGA